MAEFDIAQIASLDIADPPELWSDLGFVVDGSASWISGTRHQLGASGKGVLAWTLRDVEGLVELPVAEVTPQEARPTPDHPNGVTGLDHIVISTPNLSRTVGAFEAVGMRLRRMMDFGPPDRLRKIAFFRMGETLVQVTGSATEELPGEVRFGGLAFTVADLDATATFLGDRLRPVKEGVQGRRIASLDWAVGSTVSMAFLSPP